MINFRRKYNKNISDLVNEIFKGRIRYEVQNSLSGTVRRANVQPSMQTLRQLAPYVPPQMRRYPIEDIIADFESLFKFIGRIDRLYDFTSQEALWYDCGYINTPRENDDRIVDDRFNRCALKVCLTLENGG